MPGTLIQSNFQAGLTQTFTGVQVGDVIAVAGSAFFDTGPGGACTDTAGNVYSGPFFFEGGGFGTVNAYCTVSQFAGSITVSMLTAGDNSMGVLYRDAGVFDQCSGNVGWYTPSGGGIGVGTGPFTLADTTIVTFLIITGGGGLQPATSDTGDTLIDNVGEQYIWERFASGPGNSDVRISTPNSYFYGQMAMAVLTFSKPLARPPGVTEQYAFRGGIGRGGEDTPIGEFKVPLATCLPYAPRLGSPVVIGCSYTGCNGAMLALSAEDDYGNVYTQDLYTVGNVTAIALFHTIVTNLPPAGEVFRARLTSDTITCSGALYQTTGVAIAEFQVDSLVSIAAAGWNHEINSDPDQTLVSGTIVNVPASTWLFGVVIYPGATGQTGVTWTPLEGYAIEQQQNFIQFPFATTNSARVGAGAILTKFVNTLGDYDVQAIATQIGAYNESGSIALLALTVTLPTPPPPGPLAIACPVSGTGTVGVPYLGMIMVSGGTPPYHYELI